MNREIMMFIVETRGMQATYDMYVENSKASIMKRSGMDVDLVNPKQTLPLYSVCCFKANH